MTTRERELNVGMDDKDIGEQSTEEQQFGEIKFQVDAWAREQNLVIERDKMRDEGEWQTDSGGRLHIWDGEYKLVVTEGDQTDMRQWVIKMGGIGVDSLTYRRGPTNLYGTGNENELGWCGEEPFGHGEHFNKTDVFGATNELLTKLKTARR